jgi:hypothetical protein
MTLMESLADLGGLLVGFGLTILIYSYLVRDNPLYRLAIHLLVGATGGYVAVVVVSQVIAPVVGLVTADPYSEQATAWFLPLLLTLLLLLKASSGLAWLGNSAMAVIVAIGAGVGLVGALVGTLIPLSTSGYSGALGALVALLTIVALAYFFFYARSEERRPGRGYLRYLRAAGRFVIIVALGGVFAGLLNSSLVLLSERVGYFIDRASNVLGLWLP